MCRIISSSEWWSPLTSQQWKKNSMNCGLRCSPIRIFKGVPSMQRDGGKTALFYHAKDDLPEVRGEVFKVLLRHEFSFYGIVRTMSAVHRRVVLRNQRDPTYRYAPSELYDSAVRRLFDKKLHTEPAYKVVFASRGKARTRSPAGASAPCSETFQESCWHVSQRRSGGASHAREG
jgi:hypothetical protein